MEIKKKTTMPKYVFDSLTRRLGTDFSKPLGLFPIEKITNPYSGQLAFESYDNSQLCMYMDGEWWRVDVPMYINPVGCYKFGEFVTYYLYWIRYMDTNRYDLPYMLSTIPIKNVEQAYTGIPLTDDQIHDRILDIIKKIEDAGGVLIFTGTANEAGMQACIKAEQYKYEMISAVVKQFENVSCEFIPEGEERNEN